MPHMKRITDKTMLCSDKGLASAANKTSPCHQWWGAGALSRYPALYSKDFIIGSLNACALQSSASLWSLCLSISFEPFLIRESKVWSTLDSGLSTSDPSSRVRGIRPDTSQRCHSLIDGVYDILRLLISKAFTAYLQNYSLVSQSVLSYVCQRLSRFACHQLIDIILYEKTEHRIPSQVCVNRGKSYLLDED